MTYAMLNFQQSVKFNIGNLVIFNEKTTEKAW
jgi:hypothetical protein